MDERSMNEGSPQLLDLIPNEREWHMINNSDGGGRKSSSEERKLELSLAPPGEEQRQQQQHWSLLNHRANNNNSNDDESLLSLGNYFPHAATNNNGFKGSSSFLQTSCTKAVVEQQNGGGGGEKKKVFCSSAVSASPSPSSANTAVSNTSQKRTAPGPVVGWPPIRSFRKNLATTSNSSSKPQPPPAESPKNHPNNKVAANAGKKPVVDNNNNYGKGGGLFVKINMDGVPIGRKVDLNAYDTYENLSIAVDHLFRGLLAAQRDSCAGGVHNKQEEEKPITGLLDGSGEYTLVYEDNEGDRMLVGDVPWHMFVSTVKRLRVLKSSELSAFTLGGGNKQETRQ